MDDLVISIRNYTESNYKEIIDSIKISGFKSVFIEWYDDNLELQEKIYNYVKEKELNILFAHLGYQNNCAFWKDSEEGDIEADRYIEDIRTCKNNGIDMVVIHPTLGLDNPSVNELGLIRINKILDAAKELNVKVAFENIELLEHLEYIIENIDKDNLGVCFDVGHCHLFSNDRFNEEIFKNKIFTIHLHDNYQRVDDHYLPFDGTVDWDNAVKRIIKMNYNGPIVLECGYNNYYKDISIEDYYKLAYKKALLLKVLFEVYK